MMDGDAPGIERDVGGRLGKGPEMGGKEKGERQRENDNECETGGEGEERED